MATDTDTVRSDVYGLPDRPLAWSGAWRTADPLGDIDVDELSPRAGCSITLRRAGAEQFVGATIGADCVSRHSGASYATAEVTLTPVSLTRWDRGSTQKGGRSGARNPAPTVSTRSATAYRTNAMPFESPSFAACLPGLEPLVHCELRALDIPADVVPGGATFRGDAATVMRACLWLGTASHVRLRVGEFRCRAPGELARKARELPWKSILHRDAPLSIQASSRRSRVYHTGAIKQRIADAIADALGGMPPDASADDDSAARIAARFHEDTCTISLDATGTPLHRRGYRLDVRKAPLREDIAHALVLASGHTTNQALLDPFCGSGAIAIEAAGLVRGLPPGRLRTPPLTHTALFDADAWREALQWRPPGREDGETGAIHASDRDTGAVQATTANAERAGVADIITATVHAFAAHPWLQPDAAPARGMLVSNPPFGLRVSAQGKLLPLYQTIGRRVQGLGDGWRALLLTHDPRLARRTGLPLKAAFTTKSGGLAVTAMATSVERKQPTEG